MKGWRLLVLFFCLAAPTAGDIGSCGQTAADLDGPAFFAEKRAIDCRQCNKCNFSSKACIQACNGKGKAQFDDNCFPLVHDGEVCLHALSAARCKEYAAYIDDAAPSVPTECNFCPLAEQPAGQGGAK